MKITIPDTLKPVLGYLLLKVFLTDSDVSVSVCMHVCVYACVCVSNTFKNYGSCCCLVVKSSSFVMPWTVAYQVPLSMGFARQNTDVGCHFLLW